MVYSLFKFIIPIILLLVAFICLFIGKKKLFVIFIIFSLLIFGVSYYYFSKHLEYKESFDCFFDSNKCKKEEKMENNNVIEDNKENKDDEEINKNNQVIEDNVVPSVSSDDKKPEITVVDGATYADGILIVNKSYSIPSSFMPNSAKGYSSKCNTCLFDEVTSSFNSMKADASAIGLNIYISSGYRSYNYQNTIYNNYVSRDGKSSADKYSARPGHSEHQTGLAFDLNSIDDSFASTSEGKWINNNCYKYGFILRYPKGKENETGYMYESWHLRYVGKDLASKLYNNGDWITLEDYFDLSSSYGE